MFTERMIPDRRYVLTLYGTFRPNDNVFMKSMPNKTLVNEDDTFDAEQSSHIFLLYASYFEDITCEQSCTKEAYFNLGTVRCSQI